MQANWTPGQSRPQSSPDLARIMALRADRPQAASYGSDVTELGLSESAATDRGGYPPSSRTISGESLGLGAGAPAPRVPMRSGCFRGTFATPRPRLWCWGPGAGLRNFERFDELVVLPKEIKRVGDVAQGAINALRVHDHRRSPLGCERVRHAGEMLRVDQPHG